MIGILEHVGRGLVNGHRARSGGRIGLLTGVKLARGKTKRAVIRFIA